MLRCLARRSQGEEGDACSDEAGNEGDVGVFGVDKSSVDMGSNSNLN